MAVQKKRKGKTFVTEHYLQPDTVGLITEILVELYNVTEAKGKRLFVYDELMVWVDIQGFRYATSRWKSIAVTVPWRTLKVSHDDRVKLFTDFSRVYDAYGGACDDPQSFHVKLNEDTIHRVNDLFSL